MPNIDEFVEVRRSWDVWISIFLCVLVLIKISDLKTSAREMWKPVIWIQTILRRWWRTVILGGRQWGHAWQTLRKGDWTLLKREDRRESWPRNAPRSKLLYPPISVLTVDKNSGRRLPFTVISAPTIAMPLTGAVVLPDVSLEGKTISLSSS